MLYKGTDTYSTVNMTVVALMTLLDQRVVELIGKYVDKRPVFNWATPYGFKFIYRTKRDLTHGGNPTGGHVYIYKERKRGWFE